MLITFLCRLKLKRPQARAAFKETLERLYEEVDSGVISTEDMKAKAKL